MANKQPFWNSLDLARKLDDLPYRLDFELFWVTFTAHITAHSLCGLYIYDVPSVLGPYYNVQILSHLKTILCMSPKKDWTYPDAEPTLEWIDIPLRDIVAANKALEYMRITEIEFATVRGTTRGVVMIDDAGFSI